MYGIPQWLGKGYQIREGQWGTKLLTGPVNFGYGAKFVYSPLFLMFLQVTLMVKYIWNHPYFYSSYNTALLVNLISVYT